MIDMDDSSQSDAAPDAAYTLTGTNSETHTRQLRKYPHFFSLVPPNSPELLIIWAAFQRTSDYTFSTAPQA